MTISMRIGRFWILCLEIIIIAIISTVASDASAADVTLAWDPNSETDLAGYRLHYGAASGSYSVHIDVRNVTTYTVTGLTAGQTYYFAATAYNTSGNESGYSNSVSYTVPVVNGAPSTPATPSGPASALVNTSVTFSTSATDPNGDSLQYRYDWGGGVLSTWGAASQSRSWAAAGQYAVKAQARDSQGALSGWSAGRTVTVTQSSPPVTVDSDGDGVPDSQDAFPNDPKEWTDANGNGVGDNADAAATAATASTQAPAAPSLVSPANDALVSAMPVLKTGAFRTTAAGATHAKTRWLVFRDEDDACVLDIQSAAALTNLTLPRLVLDEGTPYFWRAQFIDSKGRVSAWSDYEHFATGRTGSDLNANGIPDAQEVPSTVDLDRDGVRDNQQTSIKSVKMEGTSVQIGVSIKGSPTAIGVEAVESEDPRQPDSYAYGKPHRMPFGLINFKIAVARPGDQTAVKLHFSEAAPYRSKWYKYDPTADRWSDFSYYARFAADRRSVTLTLRDGGPGDADGVANGVIVDPAGVVEADADVGGAGSAGDGGAGGGCFIETVGVREPGGISLAALGLCGVLTALRLLRRRRSVVC
ncbi:MAG: choice-of-anchor U domain-containing protein [Desulfobacterales bacterium]